MLEKALDFDTGNFKGQGAPIILYLIRLAARVEEYVNAVISLIHARDSTAAAENGVSGLHACATAFTNVPEVLAVDLLTLRIKLTEVLRGRAFDMLEQWRTKLVASDSLGDICEVVAHMALIFRSAEEGEDAGSIDDRAAKTLLTAQVYLTSNFAFNLEARDVESVQISQEQSARAERLEFIFALVQKFRRRILDWIEPETGSTSDHKGKVGLVLEAVINILTGKGRLNKDDPQAAPRVWASLGHTYCKGRLCPDTEKEGYRAAIQEACNSQSKFEDWLQTTTTAAVGTEINLQYGTFTLRSNQTELLDVHFTESIDFATVLGHQEARLQCARLLKTSQCEQVRLMFRHDLHFWETDVRRPKVGFRCPNLALPDWVNVGLKRIPKELRSLTILFEDTSGDRVRGQIVRDETLFEVCLFRTFNGSHTNIFKVVSYGRRFLRTLVFSSSPTHCLHDLMPSLVATHDNQYEVCCGQQNFAKSGVDRFFGRGVVISRALSSDVGEQVFVPKRFLLGLLPSALLGNE